MGRFAGRQQLLLVDDEENTNEELAERLEGEGFRCYKAFSADSALEQITLHPGIALVITSLRMPEESGISLIEQLREHTARHHLPVIATTAHADMDDVSDLLRLQVLDLLRKPIQYERLLDTLDTLFPDPKRYELQR